MEMVRTEEKPFEEQLEDDEVMLSNDVNSIIKASPESESMLQQINRPKQSVFNFSNSLPTMN